MKRLFFILILSITVVSLSSCKYLDIFVDDDVSAFQATIIESRDYIRTSSIRVETVTYRGGLISSIASESQGSGVIYAEDETYYYALTNFHVIDTGDSEDFDHTIYVFEYEEAVPAELIAQDQAYDLAVLRFEKGDFTIPLMDLTKRLDIPLERGEMVLAVGSPSRINAIVTFGEYKSMINIDNVEFKVIFHDALIYSGSSGGALTDANGYIIGINTWGSSDNNAGGLAVPIDKVIEFLTENDLWSE